ncbi:hypothetical protein BC833DRAFT_603209 [Globomyces pollinis-pini]|nr:hypothetical protein BC833DRAFT_603209 [Globomyces pollinis-pini]
MKRPRGLKKSKLEESKKAKLAETAVEDEDTLVVEVKGQNDVEELSQLYDSALAQLNDNNVEQAVMLFRGVVHECDKMIRIRHGDIPNADEEERELLENSIKACPVLPYSFYLTYANALYHLSLIDSDDPKSFLDVAMEMAEKALDLEQAPECLHVISRILIQSASLDKSDSVIEEFKKYFKNLVGCYTSKDLTKIRDLVLEISQYSHNHVDTLEDSDEKQTWIEFNAENWKSILNIESDNVEAQVGLGNGYLCLADELIQKYESDDGDESVERSEIESYLSKAIASFTKALKQLESTHQPTINILLLLGETQVHMGNIVDQTADETEIDQASLNHFQNAVDCFQKVQALDSDALPSQFKDFLTEWEDDFKP